MRQFEDRKGRGKCLVSYAPIFTSLPTIVLVFKDFQFLKKKKKKIFFFSLKKKKIKKKKIINLKLIYFFYSRNRVECVVSYEHIF